MLITVKKELPVRGDIVQEPTGYFPVGRWLPLFLHHWADCVRLRRANALSGIPNGLGLGRIATPALTLGLLGLHNPSVSAGILRSRPRTGNKVRIGSRGDR